MTLDLLDMYLDTSCVDQLFGAKSSTCFHQTLYLVVGLYLRMQKIPILIEFCSDYPCVISRGVLYHWFLDYNHVSTPIQVFWFVRMLAYEDLIPSYRRKDFNACITTFFFINFTQLKRFYRIDKFVGVILDMIYELHLLAIN